MKKLEEIIPTPAKSHCKKKKKKEKGKEGRKKMFGGGWFEMNKTINNK
jgi:hypothetical protein